LQGSNVSGTTPMQSVASAAAGTLRKVRIDLLRGISILLVVLDHLAQRIPPGMGVLRTFLPARIVAGFFTHGYEAVFIFFVISGFLITSLSLGRWHRLKQIDLKAFYALRFARIVPCLLVLVAALSVLDLLGVKDYVMEHDNQTLPGALTAALGLYLNWYEGYTGQYLPAGWDVLWSLSIEEVFYIGFPLVCLVLRRKWLLTAFLILLSLSLPWTRAAALSTSEIWHEKAYLPGMAAIATGVLTALVATKFRPKRRLWINLLTIIGSLGIAAVLFADDILWRALHEGLLLVLTFSSACLLLAFHRSERSGSYNPLPGTAWLCAFGRLSYETYLTHVFVVFAAVEVFRATGASLKFGILWYPPAVALCWLLAMLVDKTLSTPCNRALRKRLIRPSGSRAARLP
jgi:peptidoglycan/LPS O-acetylase OafA/YrhL